MIHDDHDQVARKCGQIDLQGVCIWHCLPVICLDKRYTQVVLNIGRDRHYNHLSSQRSNTLWKWPSLNIYINMLLTMIYSKSTVQTGDVTDEPLAGSPAIWWIHPVCIPVMQSKFEKSRSILKEVKRLCEVKSESVFFLGLTCVPGMSYIILTGLFRWLPLMSEIPN